MSAISDFVLAITHATGMLNKVPDVQRIYHVWE